MNNSISNSSINLLLVEKDERNRELIQGLFGEQYTYKCVNSIDEAISCVSDNTENIMLAFLSIDFELDSIEAFMEVTNQKVSLVCMPVILTAMDSHEDKIDTAYKLGALDLLNLKTANQSDITRMNNLIQLLVRGRNRTLELVETDNLTGTLNLPGLRRRFAEAVRLSPDSRFVVVYADIKNFKYFNNLFGYKEGNRLLKYWCDTISRYRNTEDMICRVSGDRIVVVMPEKKAGDYTSRFDEILYDVREHFKGEFGEYILDIIGGSYLYDPAINGEETLDQIIGYARQAQKTIKGKAGSGCAIYNDDMWRAQKRKLEINGHLENALKSGEIMVYVQPQYNYVSGELIGAECLCRWRHHDMGMLSPGEFIPALEESGRIFELDCYVWETACKYMRKWLDEGKRVSLSVNVSRKDIGQADLPELFKGLIDKYRIPAEMLRIEITESVYMEETGRLIELVKNLSKLGFSVEMDDFGSGFSSLNLLHDIPFDVLKLDMGFLRESERNDISGSILNAVIKMAHVIDIRVLAEGVENVEQAEFLKNNGCLFAQGYFFSKPIPMENFEKLLENSSISELKTSYKKYQLFNIQELFDRNSSGFFIFNNCMGPAALFDYDRKTLQPVIINDGFCELVDFSRDFIEKSRKDVLQVLSDKNARKITGLLDEALNNGSSSGEIYSERMNKYLSLTFRYVATRDNVELCFCEGTDVTNKRVLENKISELQRELRAQMEYMPGGTFKCEYKGSERITYVSEGLVKMMGYDSVGAFMETHKTYSDLVYAADRMKVRESMHKQMITDDIGKNEHRIVKADGSIIWVYEVCRSVEDEQGNKWIYAVVTDIDGIKKEQLEKRWYEKKLQAVLEMPGVILYEYNPENDTMTVSIRKEDGSLKERVADFYLEKLDERKWIYEDDVESYIDAIRGVAALGTYQAVIARALFPNKEYHPCKYHFTAVMDEDGKVYRIFGRAERIQEGIEENHLNNISAGGFRCEADGQMQFDYISRKLVEMLGFSSQSELRKMYSNSFRHLVYEEDKERVFAEIQEQVQVSDNFYCEYRVTCADGSLKWIYNRGTIVTDALGKRWYYVAVTDLNAYRENREKQQAVQDEPAGELTVSAVLDTMTQLYNHNHSLMLIQQDLTAKKNGAFMMIDVDDFKVINDTKGHIFGDHVLCEVAKMLKNIFDEKDIIGRFGGDEFICFINHKADREEVEEIAREIIRQAKEIQIADKTCLNISIGIVPEVENVEETGTLVKMADSALYHVKRDGKGGYAFWSDAYNTDV